MKTVSLSGSPRENVGKKDASDLRSEGKVPCVVYGGKDQVHFAVRKLDIGKLVYTADVFIIDLEIEGLEKKAIIQDIQFHPVDDSVVHVDFLELDPGKEVKLSLPVRLSGNAIGVRNGGRPSFPNRKLKVKGLPKDLPDGIEVTIDDIKIGDKIRVGDLDYPGLNILAADDTVIFAVKMARGVLEEEEEEEEAVEGEEGAVEGEEGKEGKPAEGGEEKKEEAKPSEG